MSHVDLLMPPKGGRGLGPRPDSGPSDGAEVDRKLEDWLVCHLDDTAPQGQASLLESLLGDVPLTMRTPRPAKESLDANAGSAWSRLAVHKARNVVVVRLTSRQLLREDHLRETSEELSALAAAGYSRIVVSFSGVERLSSQFVGALAAAARQSRASEGELRVCGLSPELTTLFEITRLAGPIAIFPDEAAALSADWPRSVGPRALPVSILQAIRERGLIEPVQSVPIAEPAGQADAVSPARRLWLVIETGRHAGKRVPVRSGPFVIGRDAECQLRIRGTTVSRRHALIDASANPPRLVDLQTTNGTEVNGRLTRGASTPLRQGDRVRIGPVAMRVAFGLTSEDRFADQLMADWAREESGEDEEHTDETAFDLETSGTIAVETIQDVLVVRPRLGSIEDDDPVERLRGMLEAQVRAESKGLRMVIDLDHVPALSSRALGMLLAFALRLERRGGRLRLCRANARVAAMLDAIRLPLLVELMPTLDDAVISVWE